MTRRNGPVIAIGLEATDPGLIERWCREGRLPTFASLMRQGVWRRLRSNTELSSGSTWASLNTGTSPGKHGMGFYHRQLKSGSYRLRKKYIEEMAREPFWAPLSRAGNRVAVLDVPVSRPLRGLNGVQLVGWGAEGLNAPQSSWPAPLFKDITRRYGCHPLDGWYQTRPATLEGWRSFSQKLVAGAKTRTSIIKQLYQQERWDLFLATFAEPHWSGHYFWHVLDERHPNYDRDIAAVCGDTIRETYQIVDRALADLMTDAPDATLLVFSNTGMGPNYSGQHLLPEVLTRLGYSGSRESTLALSGLSKFLPGRHTGSYAIRQISEFVSPQNIERVKRLMPERLWDDWTRWVLSIGSAWKHSKAFVVPSDFNGAIRINVQGREPEGRVEPGAEYDAVCEELTAAMTELINPATGKPAVSEVVTVAERYPGEHLDELPDLIVQWAADAPIDALTSPRIGTVSGRLPDVRSGAHTTYGFLLGAGRDIAGHGTLPDANIMDVAPTVLRLLGEPVSQDLDGRILPEMVGEAGTAG